MVGVARKPITQNLGMNPRPPRPRVLQLLEHDDAGPFAHHEAITVNVIRARGTLGLVAAFGGQGLAGIEPGNSDLADRALGAAGDHHVRIAIADQPGRVADRMGAS